MVNNGSLMVVVRVEEVFVKIKSIFVYFMLKSATTVTDAKVVYRILLGGQCYTN